MPWGVKIFFMWKLSTRQAQNFPAKQTTKISHTVGSEEGGVHLSLGSHFPLLGAGMLLGLIDGCWDASKWWRGGGLRRWVFSEMVWRECVQCTYCKGMGMVGKDGGMRIPRVEWNGQEGWTVGQTRVRIGTGGVTDKPLPRIPFCLLFKSNKQTSTPLEVLKSVQFGRKRVEFDIKILYL